MTSQNGSMSGGIFAMILSSALISTFCADAIAKNLDSDFPQEWWQEFPREQAESWEILPQEAGPGEVILSKRTELGILSNFAATPITLDGQAYASLEGLWQMMKFPDGDLPKDPRQDPAISWPQTRAQVGQLAGFDAKAAGSFGSDVMRSLNIDFVSYLGRKMVYREPGKGDFYQLILRATQQKIAQNPEVHRILLATEDLVLRPDHTQDPNSPPAWRYFEISMELREKLRSLPE